LPESESFLVFVFQVNWIAVEPSKTGDYCVLVNPIGTPPAYSRLADTTSVTWQFWLSESKAAEYRELKVQADAKSTADLVHRVFVTADFDVRVKPGFKPGQQINRLVFLTKATKDIRPVVPIPSQDDLA
jgi:hypothetical protein